MTAEPTRITVSLIPKAVEALTALRAEHGHSRTDTVNRALQLYAFISGAQKGGAKVAVQWPSGDVETVTFL